VNVTFRPLSVWPYPPQKRRPSLFKAGYANTLDLLEREIAALKGDEVIIGLVCDSGQIRIDGRPRGDIRVNHPGVELSFEVPDGRRLVFHTDTHAWSATRGSTNSWHDNLRAIALGLESLRAVDRYGITSTAEQYAGFLQLETSAPSVERGRRLVEVHGGLTLALKATHPDSGGDAADFAAVQAFRRAFGGQA
jgi:hypothetical protein